MKTQTKPLDNSNCRETSVEEKEGAFEEPIPQPINLLPTHCHEFPTTESNNHRD